MPGKKKASKKEQIQSRDKGPKGGTSEAGAAGEPEMSDEMSALRRQAEEMLLKQPLVLDKMPPADLQSLVHELRVQQIELEMQNDELRRVQRELEESRDKYSDLYNLAPVGHITLTEKGIMLDVTPPAATLMGKERSHLIRQPLTRFIIREDQDIYYHHNKRLFETREYQECELRMLKGDGTQFWAQVKSLVTKGNEGGLASRTAIIDITRLKQAEESLKDSAEQFRNLADSIPNLAFWANGDGYITWYNRRWYEYTGTTPEQMAGWGWQSVHDPEVLPKVMERWKASIATGEPFDMEFPLHGADGVFRPFLTRVLPLKDSAGLVLRWFGTNTDISVMKQAEERLMSVLADLERSNKELEQFAYVASHDLQEPLRMISSYTQILAQRYEGQLDEKAHKYIDYAVDGAVRMQGLINDLLAYSRVNTQGKSLETVDSHSVLGTTLRNLAVDIEENRAIVINDDLPIVRADATQLSQVFQNLISNSIKFRGADLPRINISARDVGHEWIFSVQDNGIGIEAKYVDKVFVIFQRLHTRKEYPGTGIGLAICKRIVERHGGRIWYESEPGKGVTFYFTLQK